jgi:hypothetical protein
MLKKLLFILLSVFGCASVFAQQIQSPAEFLGYKLGERFTPHYRVADYFRYVAKTAGNVHLQEFGTTNEGRPLLAMFIASPENIKRLEEIRHNNLRLAGVERYSNNKHACYYLAKL